MAVTRAAYCTRQDVKRSLDIKETARQNWLIDQAIQTASRNIDAHMHRRFYPEDTTFYVDWPNFQRAYPWRIWFDAAELADVTVNVPVVTSGGVVIPNSAIFWGNPRSSPPYTYLELNRSQPFSFGVGSTPQRDVQITGTRGYQLDTDPAGTLAADITSSATTLTVSNSALLGVGSLLIIGAERILCQDAAMTDTGQTNLSGATTNLASDNTITVTDGTKISVDETIAIGGERMLAVDVTGNVVTVIRAWDGSVLATHTAGTAIYAARLYTVGRGQLGTTAATHPSGTAISVFRYPDLIRELATAEASNIVLQRTGGYAELESGGQAQALAAGLPDLWDEATTAHGRVARQRVI